jgi:hypothetical protein
MSQFKASRLLFKRARERAALVSEQFAFQKVFGERRVIHGDERMLPARAVFVNRAREQFFARAGLTLHEHGGIRRSNLRNELEHRLHRRALAQHPAERVGFAFLHSWFEGFRVIAFPFKAARACYFIGARQQRWRKNFMLMIVCL